MVVDSMGLRRERPPLNVLDPKGFNFHFHFCMHRYFTLSSGHESHEITAVFTHTRAQGGNATPTGTGLVSLSARRSWSRAAKHAAACLLITNVCESWTTLWAPAPAGCTPRK